MRFSVIASAALLLTPFAAAQFAVRSPKTSDVSTENANGLDKPEAAQLHAREPALAPWQIAQAQDHIHAQKIAYNQAGGDLNWHHQNGASHQTLANQHTHMQGVAQDIANTRHYVNNNHPNGPDPAHTHETNRWQELANNHAHFAAQHAAAAGGHH